MKIKTDVNLMIVLLPWVVFIALLIGGATFK
jgi:hypothetical protein